MLLKSAISLILIFSAQVYASSLRIEAPWSVRVEQQMQARAIFTNDAGERFDVTNEAQFESSDGYLQSAPGSFYVRLPSFGFGQTHTFTISARYTSEDGQYHSNSVRIQADLTPDYISITGPSYVRSRMSAMYRATGHYSGRTADLTNRGSWFANYGRMSGNGFYYAPQAVPGRVLFDNLRFNFGGRMTSYTVYVQ